MIDILRRSLVGLLPLAQPAQCGQLFLANLGVPKNLFKEWIVLTFSQSLWMSVSSAYRVAALIKTLWININISLMGQAHMLTKIERSYSETQLLKLNNIFNGIQGHYV